jgi:hypothetical protein
MVEQSQEKNIHQELPVIVSNQLFKPFEDINFDDDILTGTNHNRFISSEFIFKNLSLNGRIIFYPRAILGITKERYPMLGIEFEITDSKQILDLKNYQANIEWNIDPKAEYKIEQTIKCENRYNPPPMHYHIGDGSEFVKEMTKRNNGKEVVGNSMLMLHTPDPSKKTIQNLTMKLQRN